MENFPQCYHCNTQITSSLLISNISFSCNHQLCANCLINYFIKRDNVLLSYESVSKNMLTLPCKCGKGNSSFSYEDLLSKLNSTNIIINHPLCAKHKKSSENYCEECSTHLCSLCVVSHNEMFPEHKVINKSEKETNEIERNCNKHNKPISGICKQCDSEICNECLEGDEHKEHPIIYNDKIKSKLLFYSKNLNHKTYEELSDFISEKERYITDKLNHKITFTKNKIEQTIEYLSNIKANYISEINDNIYRIGLVFKIIKIIYAKYYKDLSSCINSNSNFNFTKKYKYLTHITQEIADLKLNLESSSKALSNIDEEMASLSKENKISYIISKSDIGNLTKIKSAIKTRNKDHQVIESEYTLKGHSWSVLSLILLHDGKIASASTDKTIKIWDIIDNKDYTTISTLKAHTESVYSLMQLSNRNLVSCSKDKTIKVWDISDIKNPKELYTLKGHNNVVTSLIELNNMIASGSFDTNIIIWDLKERKDNFILKGHSKYIYSLLCLDKEKTQIASSSYMEIKIWNVLTKENLYTLQGHNGWIYSLTLMSDGRLVSGSYDKTMIIWNLETKVKEITIHGHSQAIQSLMCIEGDRIVSASWDKSIRIWNIEKKSYKEIATLVGHSNEVLCLCDIGNGKIASGSDDSLIKIWDVEG